MTLLSSDSPALIDKVLMPFRKALTDNLSWLSTAYGKSQKLSTKDSQGKITQYPTVYNAKNEYVNVLPCSTLGNFSFFVIEDPQTAVDWVPHAKNIFTVNFGLIFWYDFRKIFVNSVRDTERLKADVLRVISDMTLPNGRVQITKILEEKEGIYKGYGTKEVDTQFLMHPYGGFRVEGVLTFKETC